MTIVTVKSDGQLSNLEEIIQSVASAISDDVKITIHQVLEEDENHRRTLTSKRTVKRGVVDA